MKKPPLARICQLLFLTLFLVLFLMTEYRGSDRIVAAVNGFFRANPLTAVTTLLATKSWVPLLFPGLLVLFFSLFLGRFFCGWLCPLGTLLDLVSKRVGRAPAPATIHRSVKYWLLVPLLAGSLLGLNLAGLFDPIAILLRGLTFALHPLLGNTVRGGWRELYAFMGERRDLLAPAYKLVSDYLLPFREALYPLAFASLLLLGGLGVANQHYQHMRFLSTRCAVAPLRPCAFAPLRQPSPLS